VVKVKIRASVALTIVGMLLSMMAIVLPSAASADTTNSTYTLSCPSPLGALTTDLAYTFTDSADPAAPGSVLNLTVDAPLPQVDAPVTATFISSVSTYNIPAGLNVTSATMVPASNADFTSATAAVSGSTVVATLKGSFPIDGSARSMPQLRMTATVTGAAGSTITWNTPATILGTANAGAFGTQTSNCTFPSPGPIGTTAVAGSGNAAPVAASQSVAVTYQTGKAITLSATDPNGDPLTYAIVAAPAHGTLSGTAPAVTYTPAAGYSGADSFTFRANDGSLSSNVATVSLSVSSPGNRAPVAVNKSVTTPFQTAVPVVVSATDADGNALTYSVVASPAHGALSGSAPNLTYTPATGYSGGDSFTFKANDGIVDSNIATATIVVQAADSSNRHFTCVGADTPSQNLVNVLGGSVAIDMGIVSTAPPTAVETTTFGSDFTWTVLIPQSFMNLAKAVSPTLTVQNMTFPVNVTGGASGPTVAGHPAAVTLSTAVPAPPQTFGPFSGTYTAGNAGQVAVFSAGQVLMTTTLAGANGPINVNLKCDLTVADPVQLPIDSVDIVAKPNTPPVASDRTITTNQGAAIAVGMWATDADANGLTFKVVVQPTNGTITGIAPDVTYTPKPGFSGTDSFTYKANDGKADSNIATVTVTVRPSVAPMTNGGWLGYHTSYSNGLDDNSYDVYYQVTAPVMPVLPGASIPVTVTWSDDGIRPFGMKDVSHCWAAPTNSKVVSATGPGFTTSLSTGGAAPSVFTVAPDGSMACVRTPLIESSSSPCGFIQLYLCDIDPVTAGYGSEGNMVVTIQPTVKCQNLSLGGLLTTDKYVGAGPIAQPAILSQGSLSSTGGAGKGAQNLTAAANPQTVVTYSNQTAMTPITVPADCAGANKAPVATAAIGATVRDKPLALVLKATDADGDALSFAVLTNPAHGTLSGVAPNLTYRPAPGYQGLDGFKFRVFDGKSVVTGNALVNVGAPVPVITAVTPNKGPVAGGTTVTITGTGFTAATAVKFQSTTDAASFTVVSDTQIVAVSPAHAAGLINVFVTTKGGTSAVSVNTRFTFQ
jgi:hypothetical protein